MQFRLIVGATAVLAALGQTGSRAQQPSDYALYFSFFHIIMQREAFVERVEATGKDTKGLARKQFRTEAGLTEHEETLLKDIARRFVTEYAALAKKADATSARRREQRKRGETPPDGEMAAFQEQREALVSVHLQELKSAFGSRYAHLHSFVLTRYGPGIHDIPPRDASKR